MREPIVKIAGLKKNFGPRIVLDDLSLTVGAGETYGFVGPNGAGKTTTIRCMLGFLTPDSGEVSIFGSSPRDLTVKKNIGFCPERPYFYDHLNALETLHLFGKLAGMNSPEISARAKELLEKLGLAADAKKSLGKYSKGMVQRIGLAQAVLHKPKLLILDEPFSGLDPLGRKQVEDLLKELKSEGVAIFFSSHVMADIERLGDRIGIIAQGRVINESAVADLLKKTRLGFSLAIAHPPAAVQQQIRKLKLEYNFRGGLLTVTALEFVQVEEIFALLQEQGGTLVSLSPHYSDLETAVLKELENAG
jgi:ABC-2 type transport system ATP-binding protein